MFGAIIAIGLVLYSIAVFVMGYSWGSSTVMRKLPPQVRERIIAGEVWRARPRSR